MPALKRDQQVHPDRAIERGTHPGDGRDRYAQRGESQCDENRAMPDPGDRRKVPGTAQYRFDPAAFSNRTGVIRKREHGPMIWRSPSQEWTTAIMMRSAPASASPYTIAHLLLVLLCVDLVSFAAITRVGDVRVRVKPLPQPGARLAGPGHTGRRRWRAPRAP